jgi:hypothetical protein
MYDMIRVAPVNPPHFSNVRMELGRNAATVENEYFLRPHDERVSVDCGHEDFFGIEFRCVNSRKGTIFER